jgi:transcriptional regulator GlxA family with amidase domain
MAQSRERRFEPQSTTRAFDERYSEGADYVVVPAMQPRNNQFIMDWIMAQHRKGAKIMSICNGSLTVAAAGLLNADGQRRTGTPSARCRRPIQPCSGFRTGAMSRTEV